MTLTVDEQHRYWLDGKHLDWPSPTFLLDAMKVVDYETLANYDSRWDYYRSRGSQVHYACYLDDTEPDFDLDGLKPDVKIRVERWRNFKKDSKIEILQAEQPIHNNTLQMVGCFDRLGALKLRSGEQRVLIDIKAGDIPKWTGLQLAFYELILMGGPYRRYGIGLGKDPYDLKEFNDHRDRTRALTLLGAYRIREEYK